MATSTTSHWTKPATRTEIIDTLVEGVDRYNPQNVEILEDYLYQQIRQGEYDCLSNLAILKLYQFNPDLYSGDVVVKILVKALTAAPAPDFNLCLAFLGERWVRSSNSAEEDPVPTLLPQLQYLYTLLRTCRFSQFWEAYRSDDLAPTRNYTSECAGFEDAIREVVIKVVTSAFTRIGRSRLEKYLDLEGGDFDDFVAHLGWTVDSKGISIPPNPDNQIQATVIREDIQLPQLSKIIAHAQVAQ